MVDREKLLVRGQSFFVPPSKVGDAIKNANFPTDPEGRVYHLGVKRGEVCNRIISVGDTSRASVLASYLDQPAFTRASSRGFVIHTGLFKGVPISIIATGMGMAMMDFVIREARAIVDGTMVCIRLGTCGTPQSSVPVGSFTVAEKGSVYIARNYDEFLEQPDDDNRAGRKGSSLRYYNISRPVPADKEVSERLLAKLRTLSTRPVVAGLNATADTFYCSQGRTTEEFDDRNNSLVDDLVDKHEDLVSLEMETYQLLHLALVSKGKLRGAAVTIVLAQRKSNEFLDLAQKRDMEKEGGCAVLETLAELKLDDEMHGPECVWENN